MRSAILPGVAAGDTVLTWAFTEADPRLLPETIKAQAVADGDSYVINGTKMFVDNFVVAAHCLVACRTAAASAANGGLTLFLVDTKTAGLSQTPLITLAKDRVSEVKLTNVRVPKANMVGGLNQQHRSSSGCRNWRPRCCARRCWARRGKIPRWLSSGRSIARRSASPSAP